jgi:hypothetical protein
LWALRENASDETLSKIERALESPTTVRGAQPPRWYGSEEDAWAQFQAQMRT